MKLMEFIKNIKGKDVLKWGLFAIAILLIAMIILNMDSFSEAFMRGWDSR